MIKDLLKDFYNHLLDNMLADGITQEASGHGENRWTADMWTEGVCKCLIKGVESYREKIPQKFRNSSGYKMNQIINAAEIKYKMYENLKNVKEESDVLCVGEVGRGLDILLANMIKKWKKIICYDHNPIYNDYLRRYFDDNIIFHHETTLNFFNSKLVNEKSIMLINHTRARKFDLLNKENIIHFIFNGDLQW